MCGLITNEKDQKGHLSDFWALRQKEHLLLFQIRYGFRMQHPSLQQADIPSPSFVVDLALLRRNLDVLEAVQARSGAKIILALKGYAMFSSFSEIRKVLHGTTASSIHEARLGAEEFGGEVHGYAVAYLESQFLDWCRMAHHLTFNSLSQWARFSEQARQAGVSCGIRINPEYSEVQTDLYNPCRAGTRFGVTAQTLGGASLEGLEGLHFHSLCEQGADVLARTLDRVEDHFGFWLEKVRWLNMGGGHHITRPGYDLDLLVERIVRIKERYGLEVYLEPGEAVALNTGFLVSSVVDLIPGDPPIAILDTSATAHMPDVLEMPYRPRITGAGDPGTKPYTYRLGGLTCLAGDEIGLYAFDQPLTMGQRLVFHDMAHYTMVKTTHFNGIDHPSLVLTDGDTGEIRIVRTFGYSDFRNRLS